MNPTKRIGPKMLEVQAYVAAHPGCCKLPAAKAVGPKGSLQFGYRTVNRAIKAGLITAMQLPNKTYQLQAATILLVTHV